MYLYFEVTLKKKKFLKTVLFYVALAWLELTLRPGWP